MHNTPTRTTLIQFIKFLGVGVANTLIGLSVIYATKWFLGAGDVIANATGAPPADPNPRSLFAVRRSQ